MQNSHLTVLRQATQLSLAQSESAKALQSHTADNVGVSLLLFQYEDCKKLFSLWDFSYHLCDATTPRWRSAALRTAIRRRTLAPEAGKKLEETDKKAILCNKPDKRDG